MALKFQGNYLNRYEQAHDLYQNNPFYNDKDWETMSRRGELDMYSAILHDSSKLPSYEELQKEYNLNLLDTTTKFTVFANELYGDRTNVDETRKEDVYDEQGNVTGTNEYKMSDYEYTKKLLQEKATALVQEEARRIAQEQKDANSNFFTNIVGGINEFLIGGMETVNSLFSVAEGVYDGFVSLSKGGTFGDGFRAAFNTTEEGSADWRIFDNVGWTDALIDWNINNTDVRDLDGNINNNLAGFFGQLTRMVGQYLPAMGVGKAVSAIGGSASVASGISQGLYYGSMSAENLREYASNPAYASVPTWAIVTNAAAKGAAEYLVQRGLNKLMGPSSLDKLVFGLKGSGATAKISTWSAIKKIGYDAFHEGYEEVLQQYADWIVDQAYAIKYTDFKYATDISNETIFTSFLLGALSSVGASAMSVAASGVSDFISWRKGDYQVTRNLFKSWQFKQTMADMAQQYNTVVQDPKVDLDTKRAVIGQMYVNYRAISTLYGIIGEEKFNQALNLLERINAYDGDFVKMQVKAFANDVFGQVQHMPDQIAAALKEVVENAKLQEEMATIEQDTTDIDIDLPDDVKTSALSLAKQILATDKTVKKVTYVKSGAAPVKVENTIYLPAGMTENFDARGVIKNAHENTIIANILAASELTVTLNHIEDLYKQVYGTPKGKTNTRTIAVYNAIFNPEFRAIIWGVANQDLYKFMSHLQSILHAASKDVKTTPEYRQQVKVTLNNLQRELIFYCINQTNAEFDSLSILEPKMKEYIHDHRWNKDMFMKVLDGKGTAQDFDAIRKRVNSAPINEQRKQDILIKINSDQKTIRLSGLRELDAIYDHTWTSPYDGTKYLPNNSIPNNMFNVWMQEQGLDLQSVLYIPPEDSAVYEQIAYDKGYVDEDTTLSFYRDQFQMFSNNLYDFSIIDGHVEIVELSQEKQFGYQTFDENTSSIYGGKYRQDTQSFVKTSLDGEALIRPFLNPNMDAVSRAAMTVADVVYDPSKLSRNTIASILKKYKKVTPQTTFLYLRNMFLDKSKGNTSIVMRDDGSFVFVDVTNMKNALKKQGLSEHDLRIGEHKLSDYIKRDYLEGRLKDTKVVVGGNRGYYDSDTNTIYIAEGDLAFKQFTLLHEFQHALQTEEGLVGGLSTTWLSSSNVSKGLKDKIVQDIAKHRPELFKGVPKDRWATIAEQFVYNTSGEAYAYGQGSEWDVIDFYPVLVKDKGNGTLNIVLPWGSQYRLTYNMTSKQSIVDRSVKTAIATTIYTADDGTQFHMSQVSPQSYLGGSGIILEDGTIYSAPAGVADVHGPMQKKIKLDFSTIVPVHYLPKEFSRSGFPEYAMEINHKMSKAMYWSVAELITQLQNRGYIVTVTDIDAPGTDGIRRIDNFQFDGEEVLQDLNIVQEGTYNAQQMANDNKKQLLDYPVYREINEWYKEAMPDREMQPNSLCGLILPDGTIAYSSEYWTHLEVERAAATHFAPEGKDVKIEKYNKHVVEIALNGRFGNGFQDSISIRINGSMNVDMQESLTNLIDEALMHNASIEIEHRATGVYITADPSLSGRQVMNELRRYVNSARGKTTNVPVDKVSTKTESVKKEAEVVEPTVKPVEEPKPIEQPKEEPKPVEKKESVRPKRSNTKYIAKTETTNKKGETVAKYQYTHNTYVSNADAAKSNLKYFIRKNRPIQMGEDMQYFVTNATKYNVPEQLWKKIEKGTLTRSYVMDYVRETDKMNRTTFELINEAFFHNEHVKSYKQVVDFTEGTAMADYYALRAIMRKVGLEEETMWSLSKDSIVALMKGWLANPEIKKLYDSIRLRYSSYKGSPIEINRNAARITFMKYYDGSVNSLARIASIAKYVAINGWDVAGQVKTTGETKAAQTKRHQDNLEFTIEETLEDSTALEAFEAISEALTKEERRNIKSEVLNYYAEQVRAHNIQLSKEAMIKAVNKLDDTMLRDFYAKLQMSDIVGKELSQDEMQKELDGTATTIVKPRKSYLQSMYQTSATIRNNLSPNEKKKFLEAHGDLFTDDIKVRPELYKDKSCDEVAQLSEEVKKISADVKAGKYESQTTERILKSLEYWRKRAKNNSVQKYRDQAKGKRTYNTEQTLKFSDVEYTIDSTAEIPVPLKRMLDTTFEKFAKTEVQYLTGEGEVHVKMNLERFQEDNVQRFMQLSDQDVADIINYYEHALLVGKVSEGAIRKFNAIKIYVLSYLHKLGTDGDLHVTAEQLNKIDSLLRATATGAGTDLAVFRSVLKVLNPNKALVQSIANSSGIEFREEDVDALTQAIKTGNVKSIEKAMTVMYENGLKVYKGSKRSFIDKLWKFQRMAMLSSPGTWIRNVVSNTLVSIGNNAGNILGNLFLRKHRAGQYKLLGKDVVKLKTTREDGKWRTFGKVIVDNRVARFIKDNIIDSGLMNLTTEGLTKYDIRKAQHGPSTGNDLLVDLIAKTVTTKIFNQNQWDNPALNKVSQALFKVLSDDPWINRRTISYLGKMLQEDGTNLDNGLSSEVMEAYAEAYTLAAWDYMHKPNFFTGMEQGIRNKGGEVAFLLYKQLLPFATAGWNWFVEGLNYTPVGLVRGIVQYARLEKTIDRMDEMRRRGEQMPSSRFAEYLAKRTFGKGVIGTIGLMLGIGLGAAGIMGVDEDDDKIKLKFGNLFVDISDLFGTSSILIGLAIANPWKNKDASFQDKFWDTLEQTLDQMFQDSTFSDLFNMFEYSDTFADWLINEPMSWLSTFVPNILKTFNGLLYNHKIKYSSGIMYGLESFVIQSIPGIAYAFPKKVDPYTGELKQKYNVPFIFDFINRFGPVDFKPYSVSDVQREAIAQGVQKTDLTGKYTDIGELSNRDKQTLNEVYGQMNNRDLQKLYNNQIIVRVKDKNGKYVELRYSQMTSEQKKSAIESVMTDNAKIAKIYVYTNNGGKYYATNEEYQMLRAAGVTKNVFKETNKMKGFK